MNNDTIAEWPSIKFGLISRFLGKFVLFSKKKRSGPPILLVDMATSKFKFYFPNDPVT